MNGCGNNEILIFIALISIFLVSQVPSAQGALKRCYSCRSRGDLGNCRDPFPDNGTEPATVLNPDPQLLRGVESVPCASGWCGKMLEGGTDDYGVATQRMCLQRSPSDSEERCAFLTRNSRKVFACFCKGDLCNDAAFALPLFWLSVLLVSIARLI